MSKNPQVLQIDPPNELVFKGPFDDVVTSHLKLTNPSDKEVCFKVKTTAPKQYCVRPNSGIIHPGDTSTVTIMLQPFDSSGTSDAERAKHKFMVQSAYVPPGDQTLESIWKVTQPSDFMDSKIRVVFEPPSVGDDHMETNYKYQSQNYQSHYATAPLSGPAVESEELGRAIAERKSAEKKVADLEKDNRDLKARLELLESRNFNAGTQPTESGIAFIQVALIALAAVLVGLIFGKLF